MTETPVRTLRMDWATHHRLKVLAAEVDVPLGAVVALLLEEGADAVLRSHGVRARDLESVSGRAPQRAPTGKTEGHEGHG